MLKAVITVSFDILSLSNRFPQRNSLIFGKDESFMVLTQGCMVSSYYQWKFSNCIFVLVPSDKHFCEAERCHFRVIPTCGFEWSTQDLIRFDTNSQHLFVVPHGRKSIKRMPFQSQKIVTVIFLVAVLAWIFIVSSGCLIVLFHWINCLVSGVQYPIHVSSPGTGWPK